MACCAQLVPIFNDLDEESLERISNLAIHKTLPKGTILNSPDHDRGLFIIANGKVKIYSLSKSGHEQLYRILEAGDFTGLEALFGVPSNHYAEAITDIMTCTISKTDFLDLLTQYPSISLKLLSLYSKRLSQAEEQLLENSYDSTSKRLANYLIRLSNEQGKNEITIPLPLKELANFLSMSPETLSRSLKELENNHSITRLSVRHYILQISQLENIQ